MVNGNLRCDTGEHGMQACLLSCGTTPHAAQGIAGGSAEADCLGHQ